MVPFTSGPSHSFPSISRSTSAHRPTEHFMHITGEVTNPVPLENIIMEHPMVHSAIMFGHGRYNAGVLIELEVGCEVDTNDSHQVAEARHRLEPVFERMNMFAPQHARIQKEMVLFATPTKPFSFSPFSTATSDRRRTLAEYSDEINALYKTIARAAYTRVKPPKIWNPEESLVYVRGIVHAVLGKRLSDDADLFHHGVDSLQATRIRTMLLYALQSTTEVDTRKFAGNIVYQYRTIDGLATFASRAALTCFRRGKESRLDRCLEMREMVEAYSFDFPNHQPSMPPSCDDVVLITGTTGLFGSNLLARFLKSPTVATVFALNRRKGRPGSVMHKQAALLQASGLDPALASHPKLTYLEADARRSFLGLPQELYEQLLSSVTHIVHNAWLSVNDGNLSLHVYEGSFRMLRNLVDFALSSHLPVPPRLLFISTTDILRGSSESPFESASERGSRGGPISPCDVADEVYSKSKWVGEQILVNAGSESSLRPIIIRIGPLCGAVNGRWREDALLPMIVRLGATLGALPRIDEVVRWIPVDTASQVVTEMRNALSTYLHITHPLPVSSLALLRYISEELRLPLISFSKWTAKLAERVHATPLPAARAKRDPALTLLRHIQRARMGTARSGPRVDPLASARIFGHVQITSDDAWFASPTLHDGVPALCFADVRRWLHHWQDVGMIPHAEWF